jgi:hypothetical protein
VIVYHGEFAFPIGPEELWAHLERVERFERHPGWLSDVRLDGNGLESGSILWGVITPPESDAAAPSTSTNASAGRAS